MFCDDIDFGVFFAFDHYGFRLLHTTRPRHVEAKILIGGVEMQGNGVEIGGKGNPGVWAGAIESQEVSNQPI